MIRRKWNSREGNLNNNTGRKMINHLTRYRRERKGEGDGMKRNHDFTGERKIIVRRTKSKRDFLSSLVVLWQQVQST